MSQGITYLNASLFDGPETRSHQERYCVDLAASYGITVMQTLVYDDRDPVPWTLKAALGLGYSTLVTYTAEHLDWRTADVLRFANLLVAYPQGYYHRDYAGPVRGMPASLRR
jgi:hypothetical protein